MWGFTLPGHGRVQADLMERMLSGGAEGSILLWDLERAENTRREFVHRPNGGIGKYVWGHSSIPLVLLCTLF